MNPEHAMTTPKKRGALRETMPQVTAWIDELRAAFGAEGIDAAIRAGLQGQDTFYACENGLTVGTESTEVGVEPILPLKTQQRPDFGRSNAKRGSA